MIVTLVKHSESVNFVQAPGVMVPCESVGRVVDYLRSAQEQVWPLIA